MMILNKTFPNSIILDMASKNWMDKYVLDELIRASRLQKTVVSDIIDGS